MKKNVLEKDLSLSLSLSIYIYIYIYIYVCVCVCVFTRPLRTKRMWHEVSFKRIFNRIEFRVFLVLDRLPYLGQRL